MSHQATIWHYPRCSKSRKTLAILRDQGLTTDVRRYRDDPPTRDELIDVLNSLDDEPIALVRTGDDGFAKLGIDADGLDKTAIADLLAEHPELMQRPVVFTEGGTIIGRPPERVYEILSPATKS